ncbi:hypothetical protein B0H15DRAFT_510692 [Mycena belliarum]|uniref:Uncharacterized protein n=1 Tax=Mycena belliarum TaxID=1033014 RepID=A0AAD6XXT0_9AGAR|nr:hypothetical protein B0H15DRAFT_510692 [Mycena belliae]
MRLQPQVYVRDSESSISGSFGCPACRACSDVHRHRSAVGTRSRGSKLTIRDRDGVKVRDAVGGHGHYRASGLRRWPPGSISETRLGCSPAACQCFKLLPAAAPVPSRGLKLAPAPGLQARKICALEFGSKLATASRSETRRARLEGADIIALLQVRARRTACLCVRHDRGRGIQDGPPRSEQPKLEDSRSRIGIIGRRPKKVQ